MSSQSRPFKVAALQMSAADDKEANLEKTEALVRQAAGQGCALAALPELFSFLSGHREIVARAESIPGLTSERMCALARECDLTLLAGSMGERVEAGDDKRAYNTSLLISPEGKILAKYRKMHLFDVDLADSPPVKESQWIKRGSEVSVTEWPLGRIGQAICYDLRFPELFRALSDRAAEVICVPSAFTEKTGRAHWEVLLRARAIENQAFVVAPNQYGEQIPGVPLFGHSMIIDPWGVVLGVAEETAEGCQGDAVVTAEISLQRLHDVRSQIPALEHRRLNG